MRDKLNNNPLAQMGAVAVLLIVAGYFLLSTLGGGEESESTTTTTTTSAEVTTPQGSAAVTATVTTPGAGELPLESSAPSSVSSAPEVPAPPLPKNVTRAFAANRTVALLVVKKGGADDGIAAASAVSALRSMSGVSVFVVPVDQISRYAEITQAVKVERVPALVVVGPKRPGHGSPSAAVSYGFQSPQSVVQAVVDARYRGPTIDYHP
jgi:hypothetical protein